MRLAAQTTQLLSKLVQTLDSSLVVLHVNETDRVSVRLVPMVSSARTAELTDRPWHHEAPESSGVAAIASVFIGS
jgi:hypothetical protein